MTWKKEREGREEGADEEGEEEKEKGELLGATHPWRSLESRLGGTTIHPGNLREPSTSKGFF